MILLIAIKGQIGSGLANFRMFSVEFAEGEFKGWYKGTLLLNGVRM